MLLIVPSNCDLIAFSSPLNFVEHLDPINVKLAELREALESVTAEQKYLKARDARHRHSMMLLSLLLKLINLALVFILPTFGIGLQKKCQRYPVDQVLELLLFIRRRLCVAVR